MSRGGGPPNASLHTTASTSLFDAVERRFKSELEGLEKIRAERKRRREAGLPEHDTMFKHKRSYLLQVHEKKNQEEERGEKKKTYRARLMPQPESSGRDDPLLSRCPPPPPPNELAEALRTAASAVAVPKSPSKRMLLRVNYCKRREENKRRKKMRLNSVVPRASTRILERVAAAKKTDGEAAAQKKTVHAESVGPSPESAVPRY